MDIFLLLGTVIGVLAILVGMVVKGASLSVLLNPAAALIILVGTFAAVMNSFPRKEFLNIPKIIGVLFRESKGDDLVEIINLIAKLANLARKEGLLSLEQEMQKSDNSFLKRGLGMVIDGTDQEYIRDVLDIEIDSMEERHRAGASVFSSAGSYAPTLGVLGAVVGLIGALGNLNDTEKLGHMIAGAFVATLFGIFVGYVLCHPASSRLKRKSYAEIKQLRIIEEGILSLQAGENPSVLKMKLAGMLSPKERARLEANDSNDQGKDE